MEPLAITMHMDDFLDIHEKIANTMRALGLTGQALDEAIAEATRSTVQIVQRERAIQDKRASQIRRVK